MAGKTIERSQLAKAGRLSLPEVGGIRRVEWRGKDGEKRIPYLLSVSFRSA